MKKISKVAIYFMVIIFFLFGCEKKKENFQNILTEKTEEIETFVIVDINQDGVEELVTSGESGSNYQIYTYVNEEAVNVFEYKWLYSEMAIFEGGVIEIQNSAHQTKTLNYYKYENGECVLLNELMETVINDKEVLYEDENSIISKEKYIKIINEYREKKMLNIDWVQNSKNNMKSSKRENNG